MSTNLANEYPDALEPAALTPLVDVHLIAYNHEKFIAQAIESVLGQRTSFTFRLIIGDDCSSDGTRAIARRYAEQHPDRIRLVFDPVHRGHRSKDRVGIRVLKLSTAKYVAWLDADDFWTSPDKLQKQADFLEQNPDFAICFHNASSFYEDGSKPPENLRPADQRGVSTLEHLLAGNFIPSCSVMFRRPAMEELPDWYFTLKPADWPLYVLIAARGKIKYLKEVMAAYRVHTSGSWSPRARSYHDVNFLKLLDRFDNFFDLRYKNTIDATRTRYYFELTELYYQRGHPNFALVPITRGLRTSRFRHRGLLSFYLQVKVPGLYNFLRSLRDFVRPARSNNPGVVR
jgi:glycosyltransferase involved in cell wall biosynthesis